MAKSLKSCLIDESKLIDLGINDVFEPEVNIEHDPEDLDTKKLIAVEYFVAPFNGQQALWVRKTNGEEFPWKLLPKDIEFPTHVKKLPSAIKRYK